MNIAFESFTPISALIGGVLIGVASVMLMALNGRIAGISGIFSGMLIGSSNDKIWRWMFVAGLIAGPVLYSAVTGQRPSFDINAGWLTIIAGGLLVGFGTRLGSGCTSGHGVCGLARFSVRSLVSVLLFMAAGMATVVIARQLLGAV